MKEVRMLLSEQSALVFFSLDLKTIIELSKLDVREKVYGETTMLSLLNSMDGNLDSLFDLILTVPEMSGDKGRIVDGQDVEAVKQLIDSTIDDRQMVVVILNDFH